MDAIKDQFERVRQQVAALTGSQRMLVGTLVAIMAATVLYWGRFAGSPEMVPVLDQQLSDEDIGPIDHKLDLAGVPHTVTAGKVLVPADRKAQILADLMYSQDLPRDTHSTFEEMTAKDLNPFSTESREAAVFNHLTEVELAGMIRRWPGVREADVKINPKTERHFGEVVAATAMVNITTRRPGGTDTDAVRQMVQSAADGVAGAVSGMMVENVKVIVDGRSQRVHDRAVMGGGGGLPGSDLLEQQEKREAYLEQKVKSQFPAIVGLNVGLTCEIENATRHDTITRYDKNGVVSADTYQHNQGDERHGDATASQEPGSATNTGTANVPGGVGGGGDVGAGGGAVAGPVTTGGSSESSHDDTTATSTWVPTTVSDVTTPAGKPIVKSAAVCIPISYVARAARAEDPALKDPTKADLDRVASNLKASVRDTVYHLLALGSPEAVSVDTYADGDASPDLTSLSATGPATPSVATGVAAHAKEIAVATLAVASLGLMLHLARRAGGPSLPAPASPLGGLNGLSLSELGGRGGADDADDDAEEGKAAAGRRPADPIVGTSALIGGMAAVELDDETLRTQQMLDQVSTLVKEDPDAAAQLVKRWVSRS